MPKRGINEFEVIQFIGLNKLTAEEQATVQELTTEYFKKIKRSLNNLINIALQIKTYEKEGKRKKYSINLRINAPTKEFASNKSQDWELPRAIHKAYQDILNQIKHTMHTDATRPTRK
ncbi:hypothetical protein DRJ22_05690 [Candidatus Woesearchaeota archaeon]|nr:MAG: hypothetical protein DRJ22_05690 [Candidatus Woesearchaeota archaeon]